MLTTITNKETHFQLVINTIHKVKPISKTMQCNLVIQIDTQLCFLNKNTIYLKMLKISQMLIMIINREILFQQDINMTHRAKLTFKIMQCNQETAIDILLCFLNKKQNMIFLKMRKTYLMLIMIISKEM